MDQAVKTFEYGLDSILTNSSKTLELDAFFDEADTGSPSVSFCFSTLG